MKAQFLKELKELFESEMRDEIEAQIESGEDMDTAEEMSVLIALQYYVVDQISEFMGKLRSDLKEKGVSRKQYQEVASCIYEQIDDWDDLFPDYPE